MIGGLPSADGWSASTAVVLILALYALFASDWVRQSHSSAVTDGRFLPDVLRGGSSVISGPTARVCRWGASVWHAHPASCSGEGIGTPTVGCFDGTPCDVS